MVQKIFSSALDVELMIKKGFSFLSYFFSLEERYKL